MPDTKLKEGQLDPKAYTKKIIPMMKEMQEANPEIKFFASPRPLNEIEKKVAWQPYPRWITGDTKKNGKFALDWEKVRPILGALHPLHERAGLQNLFPRPHQRVAEQTPAAAVA